MWLEQQNKTSRNPPNSNREPRRAQRLAPTVAMEATAWAGTSLASGVCVPTGSKCEETAKLSVPWSSLVGFGWALLILLRWLLIVRLVTALLERKKG